MELVDAHNHLDAPAFDADRSTVIEAARRRGVAWWVICGADPRQWDETLRIADQTGGIAALGVHPWSADSAEEAELDRWLGALSSRPLRIVGEIGLDRLRSEGWERQRRAFREQLALARERALPVVLHCVRAYPELLAIVEADGGSPAGGVVHGWSGPPDQVARAVRLGLSVSFGPLVLRDRARKARASVPLVPDDRLLVETDCPDMAPPGASRGEPSDLLAVAEAVAALRGCALDRIAAVTRANAERLVGWAPGAG